MSEIERLVDAVIEAGIEADARGADPEDKLKKARATLLSAVEGRGEPVVRWAVVCPEVGPECVAETKDQSIADAEFLNQTDWNSLKARGFRVAKFELREVAGDE